MGVLQVVQSLTLRYEGLKRAMETRKRDFRFDVVDAGHDCKPTWKRSELVMHQLSAPETCRICREVVGDPFGKSLYEGLKVLWKEESVTSVLCKYAVCRSVLLCSSLTTTMEGMCMVRRENLCVEIVAATGAARN